ncbi:MAG: glucose 1-dehydrogenase [Rhodospirillales bacterium]|nr:glucose 1-dehydrogenase [Rhodospirillales bacterium]
MSHKKGAIVITGASRGIGAAAARLAARQGYPVCINFIQQERDAKQVADDVIALGGKAIIYRADTAKPDQVEALFTAVDRELGQLAALVNNAAISGGRTDILNLTPEVLRRILDVNVVGYVLCAQRAIERLSTVRGGTGGAIVNVSSQAGQFGGIRLTAYAASKAAINTLTLGLAREVAPCGIRVNAVSPGIVETPGMIETNWEGIASDARRQETAASIPLGRVGSPDDVAKAILWLLSDEASYVTGTILPVAGGR